MKVSVYLGLDLGDGDEGINWEASHEQGRDWQAELQGILNPSG